MKPVVFLNSHPIQYFAPLYQEFAKRSHHPLKVWYCSDESIRGDIDKGFGTAVKWDIPLLQGYEHVFIKNNSWKASIHRGFFGLLNLGVIRMLYRQPRSVIVIHGWAYATHVLAILFGRMFGHTICLRAETPLNQELQKNKAVTFIKHIYLRFLFLFVNRFLYIGHQNKMFYRALGVKDSRLIFTPYAIDNKRFHESYLQYSREQARTQLELPRDGRMILYSGKYIYKKRPLDLLKAFKESGIGSQAFLVMLGEGECRKEMEDYIQANDMQQRVILTGFINQSFMPLYYRAADIFVMCSGLGETWGLSVNEAMNFALPVIVSNTCGSSYDLVEDTVNGNTFNTGDIKRLAELIKEYVEMPAAEIDKRGNASLQKINGYGFSQIIAGIESVARS